MVITTLLEMMVISLMAKQTIKQTHKITKTKYRKSKTTTDKNGRRRCKACGRYMGKN